MRLLIGVRNWYFWIVLVPVLLCFSLNQKRVPPFIHFHGDSNISFVLSFFPPMEQKRRIFVYTLNVSGIHCVCVFVYIFFFFPKISSFVFHRRKKFIKVLERQWFFSKTFLSTVWKVFCALHALKMWYIFNLSLSKWFNNKLKTGK